MARTIPSGLQDLLDLPSCETQTTLDLTLVDTTEYHVATAELTVGAVDYTADLRRSNELKQTVFSPPDRGGVIIQNVDKVFGGYVVAEDLVKAEAVIGRYHADPAGVLPAVWVELFRGEAMPLVIDETQVQIEILGDMAAAGYCIGANTLAENCQSPFKHALTCGYSGGETTCNKKHKSKLGCLGRSNEHRFFGMEYPDIQIPAVGLAGPNNPPPGHQTCPRLDQYVLIRCITCSRPVPKIVRRLKPYHELFNPVSGMFHEIKSLTVVHNEPIWCLTAENGARNYSSFSHLVLWYREHVTGEPVANFVPGDPVLTWTGGLEDSKTADARYALEWGSVMKIEMMDGHIYAAGDEDDKFLVCHNSKQPPLD